jgi:hypothetical protein
MADLLRRHRAELAEARTATVAAQARADALAAALALTVAKRIAAMPAADARLWTDLLTGQRIEIVSHVGETLTPELEAAVDIVTWVDDAGPAPGEHVTEAFEPEVRVEGRTVHRAKLCCARALAPVPTDPGTPVNPPDAAASADSVAPKRTWWSRLTGRRGSRAPSVPSGASLPPLAPDTPTTQGAHRDEDQ